MEELRTITGAILVGGLGTRLRSIVADRPKVLAPIHRRPFLAYLLDRLSAAGLRYVVLCTGYKGKEVQAAFGDTYGALRLAYSQELAPLDTGGALRHAQPLLESDPVLVMNGDSFCDADLAAFWQWHRVRQSVGTLLLTQVPNAKRYGLVHVNADGSVSRFAEKVADGPGLISAGIYLLTQLLVERIPENRAVSLEREIFPNWVGHGLFAFRSEGRFLDIGTPEDYSRAELFFSERTVQ
jgi:NDP-sugar pyrophosphorylase family protein